MASRGGPRGPPLDPHSKFIQGDIYPDTWGHHAAEGVGVRATARLLNLDKDTVNRVILRAGEHCAQVLSNLLTSLHLTEAQLDELWTFV
ncbi:MAG: hypothetical protein ABR542_11450, partial [Desulfonatronovibrio sp.]